MRIKSSSKFVLLMIAAMAAGLLASCSSGVKENKTETTASVSTSGNATEFVKDEGGIIVTLTTDKDSYAAGEELNYVLTVTNNKADYTVSKIQVFSGKSDEFSEEGYPTFKGDIPYGESKSYEGKLKAFSDEPFAETPAPSKVAISGDVETLTLRPYVNVNYDGKELLVRYRVEIAMYQKRVEIAASDKKNIKTVSVHDPSIVVGQDKSGEKCYYIFGSHLAFAKSYDLENWQTFNCNIHKDYAKLFAEPASWAAHGSNNYNVKGFMWAPDVIYNEAMGKWCMYMSIDGDRWFSSIVLLTADELEGDWTYEGIVVYTGFNKEFYSESDAPEVLGEKEIPQRYVTYGVDNRRWGDEYPNGIDPCVFYDETGKLWMSYGSWSGGIFMLELDEATGLRDRAISYDTNPHSDAYFGTKIAGGKYVTGEASYIQHIGDYYYLFISYGNLEAKGGYNVRIFRSERPDGDYVDALGNNAYYDKYIYNYNMPIGVRLFGGYKWKTFQRAQVAQGHNSAFVDDDGRAYMIFHTRTNDGGEGHYVKTHQLFMNKEGWLVAAPYQTSGEELNPNGLDATEVAGNYDIILHKLDIDFANYGVNKPQVITLAADGNISGDYTGTWSLENGTPYISIEIDGETYSGVALKMDVEGTTIETVVFTALGKNNQITLWGSKAF